MSAYGGLNAGDGTYATPVGLASFVATYDGQTAETIASYREKTLYPITTNQSFDLQKDQFVFTLPNANNVHKNGVPVLSSLANYNGQEAHKNYARIAEAMIADGIDREQAERVIADSMFNEVRLLGVSLASRELKNSNGDQLSTIGVAHNGTITVRCLAGNIAHGQEVMVRFPTPTEKENWPMTSLADSGVIPDQVPLIACGVTRKTVADGWNDLFQTYLMAPRRFLETRSTYASRSVAQILAMEKVFDASITQACVFMAKVFDWVGFRATVADAPDLNNLATAPERGINPARDIGGGGNIDPNQVEIYGDLRSLFYADAQGRLVVPDAGANAAANVARAIAALPPSNEAFASVLHKLLCPSSVTVTSNAASSRHARAIGREMDKLVGKAERQDVAAKETMQVYGNFRDDLLRAMWCPPGTEGPHEIGWRGQTVDNAGKRMDPDTGFYACDVTTALGQLRTAQGLAPDDMRAGFLQMLQCHNERLVGAAVSNGSIYGQVDVHIQGPRTTAIAE